MGRTMGRTMADLISRAAARDVINTWGRKENEDVRMDLLHNDLNAIPAVDAAPVVHAQWDGYNADYSDWLRDDGKPIFISCCVCNNVVLNNGSASWKYCPNCGAKMDGKWRDSE